MASIVQRGAVFRVFVRIKGEAIRRTFDTREAAQEWADREEARIKAGITRPVVVPAAGVAAVGSSMVSALFDRYAKEVSPDKGGWQWEHYKLASLVREFCMVPITSLDGAVMAEWRDKRLKEVSAATVNRELNLIGAVFTRAIKEWRAPMTVNPVSMIQRPRQPPGRKRRVPDDERAAIMKALDWPGGSEGAAPTNGKQWTAWAFAVALETMMRTGEIHGLTWEHVHLDKRYVHLPKTKNGHPRDVPLSMRAVALFAMLVPEGGRGVGRLVPISKGTICTYFYEVVRALGIKDLHFHDSRREALTRSAAKLSNVLELARASGHLGTKSLMKYYHPDVTDLAKKLDG